MKIRSITELRDTQNISKDVHEANEPIFITKNGLGDMVLMSIEQYEQMTNSKNVEAKKFVNNKIPLTSCSNELGYLNVCAIPLNVKVADVNYNADEIIKNCKKYANNKIILFPELSLTSYTCGDLFLNRTLKDSCISNIKKILEETKDIESIIVFGSPLEHNYKLYNCAIVCFKGEILGIVPKKNIPNYQEFYELRHFEQGNEEQDTICLYGKNIPFSTNILFQNAYNPKEIIGVEICEDLWVMNSPHINHINNGATIILNLSASNETIGKEEYRKNLISFSSAKGICSYIYCSSPDSESTTDLLFSGVSAICENGKFLAYSAPFENKVVEATLDLEYLENERVKMTSYKLKKNNNYQIVFYKNKIDLNNIKFHYDINPFIPKENDKLKRYNKILEMQALGLVKRMKHINSYKLVLGLSGGLDSTLAYLVCIKAMDILNKNHENIIAITMPCFGTSKRTKNNAIELAKLYKTTLKEISIKESVIKHLNDIEHNLDNKDVTYENAQARERTQVLMDYANQINGIVVGTGDLSEIALGWSTYNGDHMSMYSVNCSLPKTLIQDMIRVLCKDSIAKDILLDIVNTPVSPELLPTDQNGNITQLTEDKVGPYELHDFFLFMFIRYNFSIKKIFFISENVFKNKYDKETIKKWLTIFVRRFFTQQFKRSCMPDGIKIGSVSLSPRGDLRMPSDASFSTFFNDLESL